MILSVHPHHRNIYHVTLPANSNNMFRDSLWKAENCNVQFDKMQLPEIIRTCERLVPMLGRERATDYNSWIKVGLCLWEITNGCQEGLDLWIRFSQTTLADNFQESECAYQWKRMHAGYKYTMGNLRYWAKNDSPEEYEIFRAQVQNERIDKSLQGGHADLAKYLYDKYHTEFVCANITRNTWYQFKNHRWKETQNGNNLYKVIDCDLVNRVNDELNNGHFRHSKAFGNHIKKNAEVEDDEYDPHTTKKFDDSTEAKSWEIRQKQLSSILRNLKDTNFKQRLIRECCSLFYQEDFMEKLNANQSLIGFNNGVLDMSQPDNVIFRDGRSDDFISFTTGYDYKEFSSEFAPEVQEVLNFFKMTIVDEDVREWFLHYCAMLLHGGQDQQFLVCSGVGANGKSMTMELLHKTLGDYCTTVNTAMLCGKSLESGRANPDLMKCWRKRFVYTTEPETGAEMNVGFVKKVTGDGNIDCRQLFSENVDFEPTFKLCILCNNLPKLPPNDDGIWRRIVRVPFLSRFPGDDFEVPKTLEEQFKQRKFYRDPKLQQRIPGLRQAFMWILKCVYSASVVSKKKIAVPPMVKNAIEEYRCENDEYLQYQLECLKKDPSGFIKFDEYVTDFSNWYMDNYGRNKLKYTRQDIRIEMIRRWGPMTAGGWFGYRKRSMQDDVNENKIAIVNTNPQ